MIHPVLLQLDQWGNGEIFDAIVTRIDVVMGFAVAAMIIFTVGYVALYWWSKTHAVPSVVLTLLAGVVFQAVPGPLARAGWILMAISGTIALFAILWAVVR